MKTLTPTNLIAVEVPKDATEIQIWNHGIGFKTKLIDRMPDDTNGFYHLETGLFRWKGFEILGEVTDTEISFDAEPYLEKDNSLGIGNFYKIYTEEFTESHKVISSTNKNKSFRSLLQSNGLFFENPIGKAESCCSGRDCGCMGQPINFSCKEEFEEWESYESKLIKGKLIILKQK